MTTTSAPVAAPTRTAWIVFAVAAAGYFMAVVHRTALGVAGVEALDRFAIQATALAMLSVLQVSVYAVLQVPAGGLLDRFGATRVIVAGLALMALGQGLMALAPGFGWALAARVLLGAGDAPLFVAANRLIAQHFPPRRVPVLVQVTGLTGQAGQLATAIPVAAALHAFGWVSAFGSLAVLGLLAAGGVWWGLGRAHARPAGTAPVAARLSLRESFTSAARTPGVRLGFWTHWLGLFSVNTVALLWGVPFFVEGQGRTPAEASALLTVMVVAHIVSAPVVGRLTAHFPLRRSWIALGGAGVVLAAWVAVLAPTTPRPFSHLVAFAAVLGVAGPLSIIGLDFARSFANPERPGAATGFANMGGFLGTVASVLIVGVVLELVAEAPGAYTLGDFRLALSALAVPWIVGVVGVVTSRRQTRRQK